MKIISWNVNSVRARIENIKNYIKDSSPEILLLQEIKTQNENLKRHLENEGRYNLSVADSSFDTWLDGYELGIPNRKTSIYTEGALCMLMIDAIIVSNSEGKYSYMMSCKIYTLILHKNKKDIQKMIFNLFVFIMVE